MGGKVLIPTTTEVIKMRLWTDTEVLEKLEKQLTDLVGDYHREIRRMEDKKEQTQQILSNLKMMRAAQNQ
jgi:hypothetical protein